MGGKITSDEFIVALASIADDQFIAHITVTVVVSCPIADENIATARSVLATGRRADSRVVIACGVVVEGTDAAGGIGTARGVSVEGTETAGGGRFYLLVAGLNQAHGLRV